jgi:hypothetical protein
MASEGKSKVANATTWLNERISVPSCLVRRHGRALHLGLRGLRRVGVRSPLCVPDDLPSDLFDEFQQAGVNVAQQSFGFGIVLVVD